MAIRFSNGFGIGVNTQPPSNLSFFTNLGTIATYLRNYMSDFRNPDFYSYVLDGDGFFINDGGGDMYDGGNVTSPWLISNQTYTGSTDYSSQDYPYAINYQTSGNTGTVDTSFGYISLGYSNPNFLPLTVIGTRATIASPSSPIGFQCGGNSGADGGGSVVEGNIYTGNTVSGFTVHSYYREIYAAGDPSTCDVYILLGHPNWNSVFGDVYYGGDSGSQGNGSYLYTSGGGAQNILAIKTLLSKQNDDEVTFSEVNTVVDNFIMRIGETLSNSPTPTPNSTSTPTPTAGPLTQFTPNGTPGSNGLITYLDYTTGINASNLLPDQSPSNNEFAYAGANPYTNGVTGYTFTGSGSYAYAVSGLNYNAGYNQMSFQMWVKIPSIPGTMSLIAAGGNNAGGWALRLDSSGNSLNLVKYNVADQSVNLPFTLQADTWYHIAALQGGTSLTFMINGVIVGAVNDAATNNFSFPNGTINIAKDYYTSTNYAMSLGYLKVYDYCLLSADITTEFNDTKAGYGFVAPTPTPTSTPTLEPTSTPTLFYGEIILGEDSVEGTCNCPVGECPRFYVTGDGPTFCESNNFITSGDGFSLNGWGTIVYNGFYKTVNLDGSNTATYRTDCDTCPTPTPTPTDTSMFVSTCYTVRQYLYAYSGGSNNDDIFVITSDYPDVATIPVGATATINSIGVTVTAISSSNSPYLNGNPGYVISLDTSTAAWAGTTIEFCWMAAPTPTPTTSSTPVPTASSTPNPTPTATAASPTPTPSATASTGFLTFSEVGSNVVMTASGTIDLDGLTLIESSVGPFMGGGIGPTSATFLMGANGGYGKSYSGFTTTPSNFGTGGGAPPTSTSGDIFGIVTDGTPPYLLIVPTGYTSGTNISSTQTFTGQTFSSLGLTAGTYTYTWGSGKSLSVVVGGTPGPTSTPSATAGAGVGEWYFYSDEGTINANPPTANGNTIFTINTGGPTTETFNPNKSGGVTFLHFNVRDSIGTNYTSQFSGYTGGTGTITISQNGDTATYTSTTPGSFFIETNVGVGGSPFFVIAANACTQTKSSNAPYVYGDPISITFS